MREVLDYYSVALGQNGILVVSPERVRVSRAEPEGGSGHYGV